MLLYPKPTRLRTAFLLLSCFFLAKGNAGGQGIDDPRLTFEKAIAAHGGDANKKRETCEIKVKGTIFVKDKQIEHSGLIVNQGADCSRIESVTRLGRVISVVEGDRGWIRKDDMAREMTAAELGDAKEDLHVDWIITLIPIADKNLSFSRLTLPESEIQSFVAWRISKKGFCDIDIYFDKQSDLLVRKRIIRSGSDYIKTEYLTIYQNFRDFEGVHHWTKSITYRNGEKRLETEIVEAKFGGRLPKGTFSRP